MTYQNEHLEIRPIKKTDNPEIARIIRQIFVDMGIPKVGTAYADPSLDHMYETYANGKGAYYVLSNGEELLGGAGVGPLEKFPGNICELQKMYFLPQARGKGMGDRMMKLCLARAKELGYEACYLETMPYMDAAQKLYRSHGFEYLEERMGGTGHSACPVWMLKTLV